LAFAVDVSGDGAWRSMIRSRNPRRRRSTRSQGAFAIATAQRIRGRPGGRATGC